MNPLRYHALGFFLQQGWTLAQSAGIVANLEAESGLRHDAVGDGGQAYGVAQWHPPRQANFTALLGKDISESSFEDQLYFVHAELRGTEKAAGERLAGCTTAEQAGECVSIYYERPADRIGEAHKRAALAERILKEAQGTAFIDPLAHDLPPPATPVPQTPSGGSMGAGLILGLIQSILPLFTGGAQAQLTPIINQAAVLTGASPPPAGSKDDAIVQLATQMMGMVLQHGGAPAGVTPATATPQQMMQATAAVASSPAKVEAVERAALDQVEQLNKMGPLFDKIAAYDKQTAELELLARNAAADRGQRDKVDISPFLARSSTYIVGLSTLVLLGGIIAALFQDADSKAAIALVGLGGPLLQRAFSNLSEVFAYRYGGTSSGNAADAARTEIAARK